MNPGEKPKIFNSFRIVFLYLPGISITENLKISVFLFFVSLSGLGFLANIKADKL